MEHNEHNIYLCCIYINISFLYDVQKNTNYESLTICKNTIKTKIYKNI